jgi:hypothetical protein
VDEDSGWKNRIQFPSKNKKVEEEEDDSSIYNPVNKDLRTVIESKQAAQAAKAEEDRVGLGALAPEGLPKDVTPEEIAALAAAAAQVKGKFGEGSFSEPETTPIVPAVAQELTQKAPENVQAARVEVPATTTEAKHEIAAETEPGKAEPAKIEEAASPLTPLEVASAIPDAVTFAQQRAEEKIESASQSENTKESDDQLGKIPADVMAVIASLDPDASSKGSGWGAHASSLPASQISAGEPVTMAIAAGAASGSTASRWAAVQVSLAPEESTLSLEHEMQKAHAAFAAADSAHAAAAHTVSAAVVEPAVAIDTPSPEAARLSDPVVSVPLTEPIVETPSALSIHSSDEEVAKPESHSVMTTVASVATDAIRAAVKEFETVVASFERHPAAPVQTESAPEQRTGAASAPAAEAPQTVDVKMDAAPEIKAEEAKEEAKVEHIGTRSETSAVEPAAVEASREEPKFDEQRFEDRRRADRRAESRSEEPRSEVPTPEELKQEEQKAESPVAAMTEPAPAETSNASAETPAAEVQSVASIAGVAENEIAAGAPDQYSDPEATISQTAAQRAAEHDQPVTEARASVGKKESEIAATTAAAWASWRRIRETGDAKGKASGQDKSQNEAIQEDSTPEDVAAMAVAAGAEKAHEKDYSYAEAGDPTAIASIVDSVLADLRPKIVAEISKKMGKK